MYVSLYGLVPRITIMQARTRMALIFIFSIAISLFSALLSDKLGYSGESGHLFRGKASTCSECNRPDVPGETVRSYRSVATLVFSIFQSPCSLSSLNAVFSWTLP